MAGAALRHAAGPRHPGKNACMDCRTGAIPPLYCCCKSAGYVSCTNKVYVLIWGGPGWVLLREAVAVCSPILNPHIKDAVPASEL